MNTNWNISPANIFFCEVYPQIFKTSILKKMFSKEYLLKTLYKLLGKLKISVKKDRHYYTNQFKRLQTWKLKLTKKSFI